MPRSPCAAPRCPPKAVDEFELIERYFVRQDELPGVIVGIGDDGAVLAPPEGKNLITVIDTLVEGVHFPADRNDIDARSVGHRAVAVNLSDIAAMGGQPLWMTLALTLTEANEEWLQFFATGLHRIASRYGVALVGGDTTRGDSTVISVQLTGVVDKGGAIVRSGAHAGDRIYVSGSVGDAAGGLYLQEHPPAAPLGPHDYLLERLEFPTPRLELGQALAGTATAAIDISDGLYADLARMLAASAVGGEVDVGALPVSPALKSCFDTEAQRRLALSGGDDYELCFTSPHELPSEVAGVAVTPIGRITAGGSLQLRDEQGAVDYRDSGYLHFR